MDAKQPIEWGEIQTGDPSGILPRFVALMRAVAPIVPVTTAALSPQSLPFACLVMLIVAVAVGRDGEWLVGVTCHPSALLLRRPFFKPRTVSWADLDCIRITYRRLGGYILSFHVRDGQFEELFTLFAMPVYVEQTRRAPLKELAAFMPREAMVTRRLPSPRAIGRGLLSLLLGTAAGVCIALFLGHCDWRSVAITVLLGASSMLAAMAIGPRHSVSVMAGTDVAALDLPRSYRPWVTALAERDLTTGANETR